MGAPSPLLRSWMLSQHRNAEGRAGRGGSVSHAPSSPCTDPTGKIWENAPPPGKINPDPVTKEAQGDGGKFHIQLDILLLEVDLRMSPVQGLLCCALVSPHTWSCRLPTGISGSSVPWSWAGESGPLEGWALLCGWPGSSPCALSEGFSLPSLLEQHGSGAGFGHDRISAGDSQCQPLLTTDPPRAGVLTLPAQNLGLSWRKRENTNTSTPKCGFLLLLGLFML